MSTSQQHFFSPIEAVHYGRRARGIRADQSGLRVVNDLSPPCGLRRRPRLHVAPRPQLVLSAAGPAFRHGRSPQPDRQRPVQTRRRPSYRPGNTTSESTCAQPHYHGNRKPVTKVCDSSFYANLDTAYADLLSGNLEFRQ